MIIDGLEFRLYTLSSNGEEVYLVKRGEDSVATVVLDKKMLTINDGIGNVVHRTGRLKERGDSLVQCAKDITEYLFATELKLLNDRVERRMASMGRTIPW